MMKQIAWIVNYLTPTNAIATRKETSHASRMELKIGGGLVILMIVSKIYCNFFMFVFS